MVLPRNFACQFHTVSISSSQLAPLTRLLRLRHLPCQSRFSVPESIVEAVRIESRSQAGSCHSWADTVSKINLSLFLQEQREDYTYYNNEKSQIYCPEDLILK